MPTLLPLCEWQRGRGVPTTSTHLGGVTLGGGGGTAVNTHNYYKAYKEILLMFMYRSVYTYEAVTVLLHIHDCIQVCIIL